MRVTGAAGAGAGDAWRDLGDFVIGRAGRPFAAKIYPAYGTTPGEGHAFAYRGSDVWFGDVLRFLEQHWTP